MIVGITMFVSGILLHRKNPYYASSTQVEIKEQDSQTSDLIFEIGKKMNQIEDLEKFLQSNLKSHWYKIQNSFALYESGELEPIDFIEITLNKLGKKFSRIFRESDQNN